MEIPYIAIENLVAYLDASLKFDEVVEYEAVEYSLRQVRAWLESPAVEAALRQQIASAA